MKCVPVILKGWVMVLGCAVLAQAGFAVSIQMATDGRGFILAAPGITNCMVSWSAMGERNGKVWVVSSSARDGTTGTVTTTHFPAPGLDLLLRFNPAPDSVGVMVQAGIRNTGDSPLTLGTIMPVVAQFQPLGDQADWLVTRLSTPTVKESPVTSLKNLDKSLLIHEYGGFYRRDGTGFLFGPVGRPEAYVNGLVDHAPGDRVRVSVRSEMNNIRIDPGETRWGQQVVLLFEPPRQALPKWADWVACTHGARTGKGALSGWNSWYFLARDVTGADVLAVAETALKNPDRFRPEVIQIDDGYQDPSGVAETNEKFPESLGFYARHIAATGARPGLFLSLQDNSHKVLPREEITRCIEEAVHGGFTYLKILHLGSEKLSEGKRTALELNRETAAAMRRAAGDGVYLLLSNGEPDRASLGTMDASRVGANVHRQQTRLRINDVLRAYHLQGRWFAIDADGYYMGTDLANVSQIKGGWPLVRTWLSIVGLSCGAAITSDPLYWESFKPYWRNVEVMTPPAKERTEVLDLCTSEEWPRLVGHVHREWGDSTVVLLWNPGEREQTVRLDFKQAGLDPAKRYAVWSFWDDRYLGVAEGSWTTPRLASSASQHLLFTELEKTPSRPVLIGSGLHIYCGAAEIRSVKSSRTGMTIGLTDAGAREGDLFVYSRYQPVLKTATGCLVDGITSAGENVWRISLSDRKRGVPQGIDMAIILPVTYQVWFWGLIGALVASLLFGVWRYFAWQKLERQHGLERERARIARDIHDDLGANLAEIAMISDLAREELPEDNPSRIQFDSIFAHAEENVRRLGEIVWAINPSNDTVDHFVAYLSKFTQDYLELAGVRCRLDLPDTIPAIPLTSVQRHDLFLAAKEALHNAIKHGKPTEVTLGIELASNRLAITIKDNGRGFDETKINAGSRGSANMRTRMEALEGGFERHSVPGQGTNVVLTLPIKTPIQRA